MTVPTQPGRPAVPWRAAVTLPSTTLSRFLLLIGVLFIGALPFYQYWTFLVLRLTPTYSDCSAIVDAGDTADYIRRLATCPEAVDRTSVLIQLGAASSVIVAALLQYAAWPWWVARRQRLTPLDEAEYPEVAADLRELVAEAGLRRPPQFLVRQLTSAEGLAFGRFPRYRVRLDAGLIIWHAADPVRFRTVVRHELAHLRNRDVDLTYLALSFWRAFVLVVAVPTVVEVGVTLVQHDFAVSGYMTDQLSSLAFILVMAYLALRSVLRTREFHADVLAAGDDGAAGPLGSMLDARHRSAPPSWRERLRRPVQTHPAAAERLRVLQDPGLLFRFAALDALVAGAAAGFGLPGLRLMVGGLGGTYTGPTEVVAGLIAALPITAVVAAAAVRTAYATIAAGRRLPLGSAAALCAVAGFIAGECLSYLLLYIDWYDMLTGRTWTAVWLAVILAAGMLLVVRWTIISAAVWLQGRSTAPPPWSYVLLAALAAAPLTAVLVYWQKAHEGELPGAGRYLWYTYVQMLIEYPGVIAVGLAAMALLPLLAGIRRRGQVTAPLGLSLGAGALAAAITVALVVRPLDWWWLVTVPTPSPQSDDLSNMQYLTGVVMAVVAVAAFVAAAAGRRSAALGAVYGLCAAAVGASLTVVIDGVNRAARAWLGGRDFTWEGVRFFDSFTFRQALVASVAFVLAGAVIGRLAGVAGRLSAWPGGDPPARRAPTVAAGLAAAVVVAVAGLQATVPMRFMDLPDVPNRPGATASPAPSPGPGPDPFTLPADLGAPTMCAWFPLGWFGTEVAQATVDQRSLDEYVWVGLVLSHADDPNLATLGSQLTLALRAGDPQQVLTVMTAFSNKCVDAAGATTTGTVLPPRDSCLVGEWELTRSMHRYDLGSYGLGKVVLTSVGTYRSSIRADGTAVDTAAGYRQVGATGDAEVSLTQDRTRTYTWHAGAGVYLQSQDSGPMTITLAKDGVTVDEIDLSGSTASGGAEYTCDATTLRLTYAGDDYEEFSRVS
ncbi:M48 family metalloprotease [Catellatospora tritici]|uniref:M48 family metalloprotease n=1 Tax=Catellatospora tritici TaxID=2851566 RepID=UPI001C2D8BAE|nr:M48 family metalloprotease [Catellatospora tritici]MBV1855815.1 M48 family metalloprotease [Catellatospora tritici]